MVHSFSAFFEEKRILRRKPKRTGLPDHTRQETSHVRRGAKWN
jgi:hypothetical protein